MDLNIHVPTGTLLATRKSNNQLTEAKVTQKNGFGVNVWFLDDGPDSSNPIVVVPIPEPYTRIVLSARPNDDLDNANLLFFLDDFTEEGADGTLHYTGTLNSATPDIAALFGTPSKTRAPALLDVDLLITADPADGRQTIVKQRDIWIYRALWKGTEGVDPTVVPAFPLPGDILSTADLATAGVTVGQATVDFDITALGLGAAPTMCIPFGIQKPNAAADNIGILAAFPVSATTLRAYLTAAPTEAGYKATVLFR
jgi:hypothetical protein